MVQNATFSTWSREEVDGRLLGIMVDIHDSCVRAAVDYGQPGNYVAGANIAGFEKVASAMLAQGVV
jgi:glutamate dehydrogenase (NADP+)